MWQMETEYGSLVRAMMATRKRRKKDDAMGAPAGRLTSFDGGMEDLIRGLVSVLGDRVRTSAPVAGIRKEYCDRTGTRRLPSPSPRACDRTSPEGPGVSTLSCLEK